MRASQVRQLEFDHVDLSDPEVVLASSLEVRVRVARRSGHDAVLAALAATADRRLLDALVGNPALPPCAARSLLAYCDAQHPLRPALTRHPALAALADEDLVALDGEPLLVLNPHLSDHQRSLLTSDPSSAAVLAPQHQLPSLQRGVLEAGLAEPSAVGVDEGLVTAPSRRDLSRLCALAANVRVRPEVVEVLAAASPVLLALLAANDSVPLQTRMPLFALRMRKDPGPLDEALAPLSAEWRRVARGFDGALEDLLQRASV